MGNFTFEEMNLMCIYNTGSRTGVIDSLRAVSYTHLIQKAALYSV